jgi:hypothetical protein
MVRGLAGALALVIGATAARADMPSRLSVFGAGFGDGDSGCPTATALAHELSRLHPALHADVDGGGLRVDVADLGRRYEVRVGGRRRQLDDPRRRCGERATAAALAVTLLLAPPTLPAAPDDDEPAAPRQSPPNPPPRQSPPSPQPRQSPPSPPPRQSPPSPPPRQSPPNPQPAAQTATAATTTAQPPTRAAQTTDAETPRGLRHDETAGGTTARPRRSLHVDLEASGIVDGAVASGGARSEVTGGGALRLVLGGRYVAGALGITGLAPVTLTASDVTVRVVRVPFDADLRLILPLGRLELSLDIGLALAILQLSATPLQNAATSTRLDVGARLAPQARFWLTSRLALVLGMQIVVSFAPYDLVVAPSATPITTTPRLWLGGNVGLAVRF